VIADLLRAAGHEVIIWEVSLSQDTMLTHWCAALKNWLLHDGAAPRPPCSYDDVDPMATDSDQAETI